VTIVNPRRHTEPRGFTLIEVLVVVIITGVILVTVYGSISRTLSSKGIAEERAELFAMGRDTVLRMADEIEGALPPAAGDRILFQGSTEGGQVPRSSIAFVAMNRGGYGSNRVRPGQILISYWLEPIPNSHGMFALVRREDLFAALLAQADGTQLPAAETEEENAAPSSMVVPILDCPDLPDLIDIPGSCSRVVGLRFRFFDLENQSWLTEWDTTKDPEDPEYQRIPAAVEIALFLEDERGRMYDFSTIVDLPLGRAQPTPAPTQQSGTGGSTTGQDAGES
jgi:prepilin-type N-terminal cleavage/methylation domain-containing protein